MYFHRRNVAGMYLVTVISGLSPIFLSPTGPRYLPESSTLRNLNNEVFDKIIDRYFIPRLVLLFPYLPLAEIAFLSRARYHRQLRLE